MHTAFLNKNIKFNSLLFFFHYSELDIKYYSTHLVIFLCDDKNRLILRQWKFEEKKFILILHTLVHNTF